MKVSTAKGRRLPVPNRTRFVGTALVVILLSSCRPPIFGPKMIRIEPGTFLMGTNEGAADEAPAHAVTLTRPFFIAVTEVTRKEYRRFCEATGRTMPTVHGEDDPSLPVIGVEWSDAVEYCNWLSRHEGRTPAYRGTRTRITCDFDTDGYRLPTEAEWEFAARGTDAAATGRYGDLSGAGPIAVASLSPNDRGLYDMAGNSFEWCWDWYSADYYAHSPQTDPAGPDDAPNPRTPRGPEKVRRSGSWREPLQSALPTARSFDNTAYAGDNGFRLVRTVVTDR